MQTINDQSFTYQPHDGVDIGTLEYSVGPAGSSEAVAGAPCIVLFGAIFLFGNSNR